MTAHPEHQGLLAGTLDRIPGWRWVLGIALLAMTAQAIGLSLYRSPYFVDDAPFFFRYAESIAAGQGYRWNGGEAPVWGASAPLWALLLGGLARAGVAPEVAAVGAGAVLGLASAALLAIAALRIGGLAAALVCIIFTATNYAFCAGAIGGMESPLAFALVASGLWALSNDAKWTTLGLIAGVAFAHKIDFAAFGGLLLGATWLQQRRLPWRAALLATAIGGAWYAFAAFHFGSVVPNSVQVKWQLAQHTHVATSWFVRVALLEGGRLALLLGAVLSIPALWRRRPEILVVAGGTVAIYVAGYSVSPPPEAFTWYRDPLQPALCLLAACGIANAGRATVSRLPIPALARGALTAFVLAILGTWVFAREHAAGVGWIRYLDGFERDRTAAGHWIEANTAPDATLLTGFGNIAYFARRTTIDYSFLNRRPPVESSGQLIARLRPEVIALCPFRTGVAPDEYEPPPGYRVTAIFDSAAQRGIDFYVVVMLREDVEAH